MNRISVLVSLAVLAGPASVPGQAWAQRLLDWPVRAGAGAEAVAPGAAAVFWNPAATGWLDGTGEAVVMEIRGPAAAEVSGLAGALAYRLDDRTAISIGYHYLGLGGMTRTTNSPDSHGGELHVGENVFRLGAAWTASEAVWGGLVLEHWRSNFGGAGTRLGGGIAYRGGGPWQPGFGAAVYTGAGSPRWVTGGELRRPVGDGAPGAITASYGLTGDGRVRSPGHRGTLAAEWRDRLRVAAGVMAEPDGEAFHFEPLIEARLRLASYTLSVVREELPSGFGAAHYLGLSVAF